VSQGRACQVDEVEAGGQYMRDAGVVRGLALQHRGEDAVRSAGLAVHHGLPDLAVQLPLLQQRRHVAHCTQSGSFLLMKAVASLL